MNMGCFIKLTTTVVVLAGIQLCVAGKTQAATLGSHGTELEICRTLPQSFGEMACPLADPDTNQDPNSPGATGAGGTRT